MSTSDMVDVLIVLNVAIAGLAWLAWRFTHRECRHEFEHLAVMKEPTVVGEDADFERVDMHLACQVCGKRLIIKYARCKGGVSAFLERRSHV